METEILKHWRGKIGYCFTFKDLDEIGQLIDYYEKENQKYKEVINKAINKLGIYADKMTDNANAYAICVDLLDILKEVEHD